MTQKAMKDVIKQVSAGLTIFIRNPLKYNKVGRKNSAKQLHSSQWNAICIDCACGCKP